jgi:exodeoxyribonuclease VII large subunit
MDSKSPVTNTLEWSVSDLSGALKRTIEDQFGFVRVRGEITGYRGPSASGHVYFGLKDANAKIDAVIWKGVFGRLKTKPQEGLEVIATGKITTFPGKSSYQIIIESLEPAGLGALMALLEERRRKLAAEGLFDEARKQLIPYLPDVIGVITSPTGSVIRDILHRLEDRFSRRVLVWPVRVQGETSGDEVAAAIRGFNALLPGGPIPRPDVLIVARGGGSLEDLMSFNDEAVVRAAAASAIPLISAVGHETDWTLIDYASDLRAPTPTGAAEKVVPVRSELLVTVEDLARRRAAAMSRLIDQRRQGLRAAVRALPSRDMLLNVPRQRLDLASTRLPAALRANALGFERRLTMLSQRLQAGSPQVRLALSRQQVSALIQRLIIARQTTLRAEQKRIAQERDKLVQLMARARRALGGITERRRAKLMASVQLLEALSYTGVLNRGFALVRDATGDPVRTTARAPTGAALSVQFADGTVSVTVDGKTPLRPSLPARKPSTAGRASQGGLFD